MGRKIVDTLQKWQREYVALYFKVCSIIRIFLGALIPFVPLGYMKKMLNKEGKTILDVGGGTGETMRALNKEKKYWTVNCDIHFPSLYQAKKRKSHNDYVLCDIRFLPFKEKSFDIAFSWHVIEHLPKEHGLQLLKELERVSRNQVALSTPCETRSHSSLESANPYQAHISSWSVPELRDMGFKIKRCGAPSFRGEQFQFLLPGILKPIGLLWAAGSILSWFIPLGDSIVAVKDLQE